MVKAWFEIALWKRVLGALILGVIVGSVIGEAAENIKWIGDLFVRMIRMLVMPLIFTTIVAGIYAMGDPKRLGSIGLRAFILFLGTTACAIVIGLIMGTLLQPGAGVDLSDANPRVLGEPMTLADRLLGIVPSNPIEALAGGQVLPTIFFAVLFGIAVIAAGEKGRPVGDVINSASEAILKLAFMVMELAPFGVFALIAWVAGTKGAETLLNILTLTIAVYAGCLIHIVVVHGGLIRLVAGLPAFTFFRGAVDPQLVAYSTSSSAATLPVSLTAAEENLGVRPVVASSVLPLGATINMDGTALYVGIVALFAAQAFGIELGLVDYLVIALTTILVSIGSASVPSASLFLLAAVLGGIGISAEQTAIIVGFILPFDRILDMMRTAVNVTGDLAVATTVAKLEGELDEEVFRAAPEL
ncbi:MAG: dicarboxylate/amino acid:cation symporter [Alphaproteobacteria bacterium]